MATRAMKTPGTAQTAVAWDIVDVLAGELGVRKDVVVRLLKMIEKEDCTIPFIARYRKDQTNGMDPDTLRIFTQALNELRLVQKKAVTMTKNIQKQGMLDLKTELSFVSARTMDELDLAYAPFKGEKKSSLANRARTIGLDEAATLVLTTPNKVDLRKWVVKGTEGRATLSELETGVKHIIADILSKETLTMDKIREIFQPWGMKLESKPSATMKSAAKKAADDEKKPGQSKMTIQSDMGGAGKFQLYQDFSCCLATVKSYQVLAINRGEAQKHLTVKVTIGKEMENKFLSWSRKQWISNITKQDISMLMKHCVEDAYNRLVKPFILRKARSDLTKKAQREAVEVFSRNLKKLLLTPPLRGKVVLGVDPGFKNGCKCAVISNTGNEVLCTDVIHLKSSNAMQKLKRLYDAHKFDVIGIGNGTACRETESFFSDFLTRNRVLDLAYCIVNENGASIYSVTPEAQKELPDLEPNLRSAVSIARRLQDPLIELVKIEPKHIGVGMYQHDIPDNQLKTALNTVIEDCVTFVGVDLNMANESLLCHIAGLKKAQAKNVVEHRTLIGTFINRQQLLEVKGIGEKTFQQCAGFIRISHRYLKNSLKEDNHQPTDLESKPAAHGRKRKAGAEAVTRKAKKSKNSWERNPLDQTWIHPESYDIAGRFIKQLNLCVDDLGKRDFIDCVKHAMYEIGVRQLAENLAADVPTVQLIADGLSQESGFRDIRNEMRRPIFRRGVTSLEGLRSRTQVSGRITNVTDFGVFVDIGVGLDGLVHHSDAGRDWEELKQCLGPNDTVVVFVKHIDLQRRRIGLKLIQADRSKTTFF